MSEESLPNGPEATRVDPPSPGSGDASDSSKRQRPARTPYEDLDYRVDSDTIDRRTGNFLFTVGNVGSGKSTLQNYLVHRLWTDERIGLEYKNISGDPHHDAYLNAWVQNFGTGYLPKRSRQGVLQEFNVSIGQRRRPTLELNFLEIAGEDIYSIVPNLHQKAPRLLDAFERYLRLPGVNKRFIFVSDASRNRQSAREDLHYEEDILFDQLLRYLLGEKGLGLRRIVVLFVATKWDEVRDEYRSEAEYFRKNFPQTRATVKSTDRIRASYMPFTVGKVEVESHEDGPIARVTSFEHKFVDALINWIFYSFTERSLRGFPKVRSTPWDRIKRLFA